MTEATDDLSVLPDSGGVGTNAEGSGTEVDSDTEPDMSKPAANEHRIAELGLILIGLILLQAFTLIDVHGMMFMHIATGVGILGFVTVKLGSVINRFARYYLKDAAYQKAGPPALLPRIMAPFLIVATFSLLFSGIGILFSFGNARIAQLHLLSLKIWLVLIVVHMVIYVPKLRGILREKPAEPEISIDPESPS